jgi:hypothetical protein
MQFFDSQADVIRSVQHRWLLKCWTQLCDGRALPFMHRLELNDIARMVDQMIFFDVVANGAGPRFRIRFQGARITQAYGADCAGKFLDQTQPPNTREATLATYCHAVRVRRPIYTISDTCDAGGRVVHYERLLLPFTQDGEAVSRIVSTLETVSPDGGFQQRSLMVAPPAHRYSVCATIAA